MKFLTAQPGWKPFGMALLAQDDSWQKERYQTW
jgi:hypothetical protein